MYETGKEKGKSKGKDPKGKGKMTTKEAKDLAAAGTRAPAEEKEKARVKARGILQNHILPSMALVNSSKGTAVDVVDGVTSVVIVIAKQISMVDYFHREMMAKAKAKAQAKWAPTNFLAKEMQKGPIHKKGFKQLW